MSAVGRKRISKWDLGNPKSPEKPVDNYSTDKEQVVEPQIKLKDWNSEDIPLHEKEPIQKATTGWEALILQDNVNDINIQMKDSEWEEPVPESKEVERNTLFSTHINVEIQGVDLVENLSNDEEHTPGKTPSEIKVFSSEIPIEINSVGCEVKSFQQREPLPESPSEVHGGGVPGILGKRPFHDEESLLEYVPDRKTEHAAGSWDRLLCEGDSAPEARPTELKRWGSGEENVIKAADEVPISGWEMKSPHSDITRWSPDEKCLGKRSGDFCANPPGFSERTTLNNDEGTKVDKDCEWTSSDRGGSGSDSPKWGFKKDSASDSWESKSKWEVPKKQSNDESFSERNEIFPLPGVGSRFSSSPSATTYPLKRSKPTDICNDFLQGNCNRGDTCHFAHHGSDFNVYSPHGPDTQLLPLPPLLPPPAQIDPGKWYPGPSSHLPPRRSISFPCKFYAYGNCRNGENCRFSHTAEVSHMANGPPVNLKGPSGWSNKPSSACSGSVVPVVVSATEIVSPDVKTSRSRWDKDANDSRGVQLPKMNKPVNSFTQYPPHPLNQPFRPHFQQNSFRPMEVPPVIMNNNNFPVGGFPNMGSGGDHLRPVVNVPAPKPVSSEELARITNISASLAQLLGSGQQLPQLYASLHPITGNDIRPAPAPTPTPPSASTSTLAPIPTPTLAPVPTPVLAHIPTSTLGPAQSSVHNRPPIASVPVVYQNLSESVRPPLIDSASANPVVSVVTVPDSTKPPVAPITQPSVGSGPIQASTEAQVKPKPVKKSGVGENNGTGAKEGRKEREGGVAADNFEGSGKGEEGKKGKDGKGMRAFKFSLVECIKDILKPTWKDGQIDKEGYKMVVKKVAEKVISTLEENIPQSQDKVDQYLTFSKSKLTKLVQASKNSYTPKEMDITRVGEINGRHKKSLFT